MKAPNQHNTVSLQSFENRKNNFQNASFTCASFYKILHGIVGEI
jgi:hypothetical protein